LDETSRSGAASPAADPAARIAAALGPGWTVHRDCEVVVGDERGAVDFVLVGDGVGVAVLGLVDEGDEAAPQEAADAFRLMLAERGFDKEFPGVLPIVGIALPRRRPGEIEARLAAAFQHRAPLAMAKPGWAAYLRRLLEKAPARPSARVSLAPPAPEEAWRVMRSAPDVASPALGVSVAPDEHVEAALPAAGRTLWAGMALALGVVVVVLVGMAALSHGNGGHPVEMPPGVLRPG
jgi:hypothetical protein